MKNSCHYLLRFTVFTALMVLMGAAAASTLAQQRQDFLKAKQYLRAGNIKDFKVLTNQLSDYSLHPYLIYDYLSSQMQTVTDQEIIEFLKHHKTLPVTNNLRQDWLKLLAKRERWQTYIDNYTPQANPILRCQYLQARIKTDNHKRLLKDTREIWLSGGSLPAQCDPAFELLYQSELMTNALVWKRIRLAMDKANISMIKYLSKRLAEEDKKWIARWIAMHHNPQKWSKRPVYEDVPIAHEILIHGIRRLANKDLDLAISRWERLKSSYSFLQEQIYQMERFLALTAARTGHKQAKAMLDKIKGGHNDEYLFHWRLVTSLQDFDWQTLLKWTKGEQPSGLLQLRWSYWRARALEQSGDSPSANSIFKMLATKREYYGFLAAERLGLEYVMHHQNLGNEQKRRNEIEKIPAIARARELYHLGMMYLARREWNYIFSNLDNKQMQIAAAIASEWGWHDRTIMTLGKAKAYDDLKLRFPLVYADQLKKNIRNKSLDLAWVLALTRAESAFMEDARSRTGALGLMQVMPRTGKEVARKIGMKKFQASKLLDAQFNLSIGTSYLQQMYTRFNNNIILATAAYNAGPHNVTKWLPEKECMDPEIWLETIPFNETRKYVRRILFYASVYDWRLQNGKTSIKQRMAVVSPNDQNLVASKTCHGQMLSQK